MSGWEVGDLAVCVDVSPARYAKQPEGKALVAALELGRTYRVVELRPAIRGPMAGAICLRFPGFDYRVQNGEYAGFAAERFRKVQPPKHEACEPEFVTLLTRIKRKQGADA